MHHSASWTGKVAGSARVRPARNIALVLIRNAEREAIDFHSTRLCEMKNVFVAIVYKSFRADRLEMSVRTDLAFPIVDTDRFDPVNHVLQHKDIAQSQNDLMRQHRI
jgi:hypothetical protein